MNINVICLGIFSLVEYERNRLLLSPVSLVLCFYVDFVDVTIYVVPLPFRNHLLGPIGFGNLALLIVV